MKVKLLGLSLEERLRLPLGVWDDEDGHLKYGTLLVPIHIITISFTIEF